ncbi:MAG: hypothetical protein HYX40_06010 [Sphingobacteriales bacterium]|nr:hypothetical protein [Sphingobacteriales bacterium]
MSQLKEHLKNGWTLSTEAIHGNTTPSGLSSVSATNPGAISLTLTEPQKVSIKNL